METLRNAVWQPRSQCLSSSRPRGVKRRHPGNEVGCVVDRIFYRMSIYISGHEMLRDVLNSLKQRDLAVF